MADALSVAKELVRLSFAGTEADPLTNLRLQKLLYYAQAWSLVVRRANLFPEDIQVWRHGPAVRPVYKALPHGPKAGLITEADLRGAHPLDEEEAAFVRALWESYRRYSATQLAEMARAEPPWIETRGAGGAETGDVIRESALERHFQTQYIPDPIAAHGKVHGSEGARGEGGAGGHAVPRHGGIPGQRPRPRPERQGPEASLTEEVACWSATSPSRSSSVGVHPTCGVRRNETWRAATAREWVA